MTLQQLIEQQKKEFDEKYYVSELTLSERGIYKDRVYDDAAKEKLFSFLTTSLILAYQAGKTAGIEELEDAHTRWEGVAFEQGRKSAWNELAALVEEMKLEGDYFYDRKTCIETLSDLIAKASKLGLTE